MSSKKQRLAESYIILSENAEFEIGDTVKILRAAKDYELGWDNEWNSDMNNMVGKTSIIESFNGVHGIGLSDGMSYPFFVLKKVAPAPIPFSVRGIGGEVGPDTFKLDGRVYGRDVLNGLIQAYNRFTKKRD